MPSKRLADGRRSTARLSSNAIFAQCDPLEKAIFVTLRLTGLRKRDLYFLTWSDVDSRTVLLRLSGQGKSGFSPKDYEERQIPLPPDSLSILAELPGRAERSFRIGRAIG
jgi:integrase